MLRARFHATRARAVLCVILSHTMESLSFLQEPLYPAPTVANVRHAQDGVKHGERIKVTIG